MISPRSQAANQIKAAVHDDIKTAHFNRSFQRLDQIGLGSVRSAAG
jgi:hypothetical protein